MISASMMSGVPWTASIIPQGKLLIRGETFDRMEVDLQKQKEISVSVFHVMIGTRISL